MSLLDFGKLNAEGGAKQTDPRKIFTTLKRNPRFMRPLDEQADVLDSWYARRNARDLTIKMNTGGGKTVVGLLCLQSSLNEGVRPAVYITPDNFLVSQVVAEAKELGIPVTDDERDHDFLAGRTILVTNVYKLFNGRSVFGVGQRNIPIGCVIIDDAHACLSVVQEQFSIRAAVDSPVYKGLLELFKEDLKMQSETGLLDIVAKEPSIVMMVPYWAWQAKQDEVIRLLHVQRNSSDLEWCWPLLSDCIPFCTCLFGGRGLEISPHFIPIDRILSFSEAKRRIYMTATLADDTILVSHFQANPSEVAKPIRPKGGGDIGVRMILAPQEINPDFSSEKIRDLVAGLAEKVNVVVIVPSTERAKFWNGVAKQILDKTSIESGVERLKKGHVGLTVLINKYDGIDLPGKACEVLIIDGLPEVYGLGERMEASLLDGTRRPLVRQVQRIEQGMGRGVRSSYDHCVVLLLGGRLTQRLHQPEAEAMFSSATRAQIALGKRVASQVRNQSLDNLVEVINLCLLQDDQWVGTARNVVLAAEPSTDENLDEIQVELRNAFDSARVSRYDLAVQHVQNAVNASDDKTPDGKRLKSYLKQQLAEYTNFNDPAAAQELQLSAFTGNHRLLRPLAGVSYKRLNAPASGQAAAAVKFMNMFTEGNDLIIWVNGLIDDLNWGEEGSRRFEAAMMDLGAFLGFGSERPEDQFRVGPDNLWALGAQRYLVIECKSGAVTATKISKHDTNQLNGSIVWFDNKYGATCSMTPILVHPKTVFDDEASPHSRIRIINATSLTKLRDAVRDYAVALANKSGFTDVKEVQRQLSFHKLDANQVVTLYTVAQGSK